MAPSTGAGGTSSAPSGHLPLSRGRLWARPAGRAGEPHPPLRGTFPLAGEGLGRGLWPRGGTSSAPSGHLPLGRGRLWARPAGRAGTSSVAFGDTFPLAGEGFGRGLRAAGEPHPPLRGTFPLVGEGFGRGLRAARGNLIRPFGAPSPWQGKALGAACGPRGNLIRRLRRHLPLSRGRLWARPAGRAGEPHPPLRGTFPLAGEGFGCGGKMRVICLKRRKRWGIIIMKMYGFEPFYRRI